MRSLAEIADSNPMRDMDVCLLWVLCVVRERALRRADHSSRGVLPTLVRRYVWSRNLVNEGYQEHRGLLRQKEGNKLIQRESQWQLNAKCRKSPIRFLPRRLCVLICLPEFCSVPQDDYRKSTALAQPHRSSLNTCSVHVAPRSGGHLICKALHTTEQNTPSAIRL